MVSVRAVATLPLLDHFLNDRTDPDGMRGFGGLLEWLPKTAAARLCESSSGSTATDIHGFSLGHSFPALLVCISCTTINICRTSQSQSHTRAAFGYDTYVLPTYAYPNVTLFISSRVHSSRIAYKRMILQAGARIFYSGAGYVTPTRYGRRI